MRDARSADGGQRGPCEVTGAIPPSPDVKALRLAGSVAGPVRRRPGRAGVAGVCRGGFAKLAADGVFDLGTSEPMGAAWGARRGPFPLPLSTGPGRGGAGTPWLWGPAGTFGARRSAPGSYSQGCCAGEEHTHRVPVPCPALEKELSGWRELFAAHGSCVLGPPASLQADQGQQARGQEATVVSGALRLLSPPPSSAAEKGPRPSSAPSGCRPRLQWWHLDGCHRPPAPPVPRLAPCPPGLAGDLQVNHRLCPRPPLFLSLFCAARFPAATDSAEATSSANASGASGAVRGGRGATGRPREPLSSPSSSCPPSRSGLCRLPGCQSDVV